MENFSRREFFKKFVPKSESDVEEPIPLPGNEKDVMEHSTLSRRSFIKFLGAMGTAVALEQMDTKTAVAQENEDIEKNLKVENQEPFQQETLMESGQEVSTTTRNHETEQADKGNSFTETAMEQSLVMVAKYTANRILRELKIERGNKALSDEEAIKYLKDKPISGLLEAGILGPVVEEALFRALPAAFIDQNDKRRRWEIGIPTSLLFALAHNLKREESGELQFAKSVPVSQFMGGLFYWYLMREKGYSHATFAHSMNNVIPLSIGTLLFKAFPEEKATEIARKTGILGTQEKD